MDKTDKKEEILKYLLAKIANAPVLAKEKTAANGNLLPLRKSSSKLQMYADYFLDKESQENRIIILPGLRGTGKTTMLLQLYSFLANKKDTPNERILYFSTDELREYLGASISETLQVYFEDIIKSQPVFLKDKAFVLIDEAHFDSKWDMAAKILYDQSKNIFLAITGSSALSMEISPDLARRSVKEKVFPLNFQEYLLLKHGFEIDGKLSSAINSLIFSPNKSNIEEASKLEIGINKYSSKLSRELKQEFLEYLFLRDLPFSLEFEEKFVYGKLIDIIDRIIDKDVFSIQSFKSESRETIKRVIYFLATQKPGGTSDSKLSASLGVSSKQIRNILDVLEKAHLVFSIKPYGGAGKLVRKPWKYYFLSSSINASIRHALGKFDRSSKDLLGVLIEGMVALYFIRIKETVNLPAGIFYDSDERGTDFLIRNAEGKIIPIEVSSGKKDVAQIAMAIKKYNSEYGVIICECAAIKKEGNIIYIPFTTFSFA